MGNYITYAASDIGNVRSENQDTIGVLVNVHPQLSAVMGVVCDGVGGLTSGKYASETTYRKFVEWFQYEFPQIASEDDFEIVLQKRWIKLVENHNLALYKMAQSEGTQLGTTLTVLLIYQNRYYTLQVGDSRAYQITEEVLQITEDQSLIAQKVRLGLLTKEQAKNEPGQNIILQSVGYKKHIDPVFSAGNICDAATYIICSDGFYHFVEEAELLNEFASVWDSNDAKRKIDKMIENVKQRGETDNISVAFIKLA